MSPASKPRCWARLRPRRRKFSTPSATSGNCRPTPKRNCRPSSTLSPRTSPETMPSLKELRVRIRSVRSTQKITAAMKMVADSRLRRAQEVALAARPYAERMERVLASLAANLKGMPNAPPLLAGTGKDAVHLLVVATSDRGLAGGFNATILREARRQIRTLLAAGKEVKILTIGRKGRAGLRRDHARLIRDSLTDIGRGGVAFEEARDVAQRVLAMFEAGDFDVCSIVFNRFQSAITQIVTVQQ